MAYSAPTSTVIPDSTHYQTVAGALAAGNVVPFLGAGANVRSDTLAGGAPESRLPDAAELCRLIAGPGTPREGDLLKISQYVELLEGSGPLYQRLRQVFAADYRPGPVHQFLLNLPELIAARGLTPREPLIVTTNYDHVLEATLQRAGREFDQLVFIADGPSAGRFLHRKWRLATPSGADTPTAAAAPPPEGEPLGNVTPQPHHVIDVPNTYRDPDLTDRTRPVIVKIHGAVDMQSAQLDSYVITEDDYIDYLAQPELQSFLPVAVHERLKDSHILFMGYSLRDWNLRVVLRRIWDTRTLTWRSWAVQLMPEDARVEDLDRRFWSKHDVEIVHAPLTDYVAGLRAAIDRLPPSRPEPPR